MKKSVALAICFFLLGFLANQSFSFSRYSGCNSTTEKRQGGFAMINPLLECEYGEGLSTKKSLSLKNDVEDEIKTKNGHITKVSVYYRDLNNGPWFGINEKELFSPASLLKVPVMLAYLKEAETNPGILKKKIKTKESDFSIELNVAPDLAIKPNEEYSVEELIDRMVDLSDNYSFNILVNNIGSQKIEKVHSDLGIGLVDENSPENFISVKTYSSLFRILYNSSYLSRDMSERALTILSKTTYNDGLVAGVANNTTVAHKFGIREYPDSNEKQLHDCGIIYASMNPYLLCVMTRGNDFDELSKTIASISRIIYDRISFK